MRKETQKLEGHHNSTDLCLLKNQKAVHDSSEEVIHSILSKKWIKVGLSTEEQRYHFEFTVVVGVADNGALTGQQVVAISALKEALKTKRQSLVKLSSRI